METQVARWGNSLALRIPKALAERLGMVEGRAVELSIEADGLLVRPRPQQSTLEELLARITPENLPEGGDDRPMGEEIL